MILFQTLMADVKAKTLVKPEAVAVKKGRPRNYDLGNGIYRFSRTRMFHKKAIYKFLDKKTPKTVKPKKPVTIEKKINGEKNGGTRIVRLQKRRAAYPTTDPITVHHAKNTFRDQTRYVRPTLTPGTVCILLAGPHKGKRVVLLKVLKSGLLLVTGPFLINGCPLRRVSQNYVIATSTKIDIADVQLPDTLSDEDFKRKRDKRAKKEEGDIFRQKKAQYKPSEARKSDQKVVDKLIITAIKKREDKKMLFTYLSAMFGLRSSQYPHRMKF
ncbi:large ribosomal subunit protein eL6-like isoform X1 [Diachasmimorpha longicaudata]|uniref:large ribosomal subunit protein eL6-like isoform X1 n=2 Tax=Diachasmimorpha longicaudata TaxID=58733 RepID=UPI0030B8A931